MIDVSDILTLEQTQRAIRETLAAAPGGLTTDQVEAMYDRLLECAVHAAMFGIWAAGDACVGWNGTELTWRTR